MYRDGYLILNVKCCIFYVLISYEKVWNNKVIFCDIFNEIVFVLLVLFSELVFIGIIEIVVFFDFFFGIWFVKCLVRYVRCLVFFGCSFYCLLV